MRLAVLSFGVTWITKPKVKDCSNLLKASLNTLKICPWERKSKWQVWHNGVRVFLPLHVKTPVLQSDVWRWEACWTRVSARRCNANLTLTRGRGLEIISICHLAYPNRKVYYSLIVFVAFLYANVNLLKAYFVVFCFFFIPNSHGFMGKEGKQESLRPWLHYICWPPAFPDETLPSYYCTLNVLLL